MISQLHDIPRLLAPGAARRFDEAGELTVLAGRLWLTRGQGDELIGPGQTVRLAPGGAAVIEPWDFGSAASYRWRRAPGLVRRLAGAVLDVSAAALRRGADGLGALARSAAAIACLAQGCIAEGDSIASSGAVK